MAAGKAVGSLLQTERIWLVDPTKLCLRRSAADWCDTATTMQMSSYLGTMIYRGACVAAVVWAVVILLWSAYLARPDWTIYTPIAVGGAAVIWGFGRAAHYLLLRR